jgi:endothelin-converting enzyme/putative endopeptidase
VNHALRLAALAALVALSLTACRRTPRARVEDAPLPPIDDAALDRRAEPCDDFYRFACGGWLDATEIPAERSSWSRGFGQLEERLNRDLRRLLDGAAVARGGADPDTRKLGDFWGACLDEASTEASGLAELRAEWARIDAIGTREALAAELARQHAVGGAVPFLLVADQDAKDATRMILWVYQGGLSLPDRDYYLAVDEKSAEIRARFRAHLRKMLALAALPPAEVEAQATAIEGFERALAERHLTATAMRDPARIYNRVDRAGLERLAPGLPWASFFEGLGAPGLDAVAVTTPEFVAEVGARFETGPLDAWKAYLRWHLLAAMADARALPAAFVAERFTFESGSFTGATALLPRWKHCVDATDRALGFALGRAYVSRHFGAAAKERTVGMVQEIEAAMERDLEALPWMDEPTKAAANEKLATLVNKVGYPERWRDYSTLKVGRESYFRNVLSAGRFETRRQLAKVGAPLDRTDWLMSPPTVNAYYSPSMNEMVFPAGILQPPYFNAAAPDPVNYGAIGMVVGHELTHGFDDTGRQFDAKGNLRDWWSPEVSKEFSARARCVVDQFAGYESLPGVRLNGELTLGENIADLGGLRLAFAAMRAARRPDAAGGDTLLGFTADQQFFVGYAQSWCTKQRDEELRRRAIVDPHSPARFRVNGPLSNLREFAEAFRCEEGSAMVRPAATRCEIW